MARTRIIKPFIFMDCDIAACKVETRLLFIALWCMADNSGTVDLDVNAIKEFAFPFDDVDVRLMLAELYANKLITACPNKLQIVDFAKYCGPFPKPENVRAASSKRRAAKLQAVPKWADMDAIQEIYNEAERLTSETGIAHHVDHIIPLQGKSVCGLHVEGNLQVLTEKENLSKSNRWGDE